MTVAARCSSCHDFSRGCPEGQPNHRGFTPVGPNCSMNSLGRHYRDPSNPMQPTCNYEGSNGAKCSFFEDNPNASLPYPEDITFGPVTENPTSSQSPELAAILALLNEQKAVAERQQQLQQEQADQMRDLQEQMNNIVQGRPPVSAANYSGTAATTTTTLARGSSIPLVTTTAPQVLSTPFTSVSTPQVPTVSSAPMPQASAPQVIASAAAHLNAALQSGLGQPNPGYSGLTMENLRSNQQIVSDAAAVLANITKNVPPLNPVLSHGIPDSQNQVSSIDQLYRATTVNKQLRCYEFASTGQFSYRNQLKAENCNAIAFAYGAFKHLEALKSGLIPHVSDAEFLSRIRHLRNVYEIACLSSSLSSFSDGAWLVAREYDNRVISDIECGAKSWQTLSNGIEPDAIYCAKETVENRQKNSKKSAKNVDKSKEGDPKRGKKACTTFNTHKSSEGCYWEHVNQGQVCIFDHHCSWCKQNRGVTEKHKVFNCEYKSE